MQKRLLIVLAFCSVFISFINAQSTECSLDETTFSGTLTVTGAGGVKTKASDATSNYRFGERVAIDGNIAVTTSRSNGTEPGKVYIFINDGAGNWTEQTILTASDGFAGDNFGSSVALQGNYLVVGARSQTNASVVDTGAAYLFEYNGSNTWTEVAVFEPSDGSSGDRFGESVSIEGNLILVGARDGAVGGCAYLYENDGTNTFTYSETKLEPQVQSNYSGAKFGYDVLVKDGRAYVGGPADYSSVGRASAGSVQIWDQANDGSWSRTHRLRGTETSEYFGSAISVQGDYLAIGGYNFEVSSTAEADQGRVFVYKVDINGDYLDANRVMVQNDDKDSYNDQRFGTDVVIDNGFLYVGTFGNGSNSTDAVYIFKDDGTNNWSQLTKLTSGGGWDEFSNRALAVSYPYILIGQNEDDSPSNSGAIHFISLASTITPTVSISEVTTALIGQNNATIKLNFTDETTRTEIQFSIDGGTTYPYTFSDDVLTGEIANLGIGSYNLKAKYNSGSCVLDLGTVSVNQAAYTAIPDANFEARLYTLGYDDIAGDGQVPTALIEVVTSLDLNNQNISDLTGINDFVALESLKLQYNSLTSLDISNLVNLKTLWAANGNIFNTIDVSNSTALEDFRIRQYTGTSIDLSNLTALRRFACTSCDLTSLDTSNNTNLSYLDVWNSEINTLDLSTNTSLATLDVYSTKLTSLDVSKNTALTNLIANDIATLTSLNVQNGANTGITGFNTSGTPISCILVDDATYSTTNWTNIDATSTFSNTYCNYTAIPDANFEAELENLGYDDISNDGQVPTALIEVVTVLDVNNKNISDLTGIQDFTALVDLNCENNSLTFLDVSNNNNLQKLNFNENNITAIHLGVNANLVSIEGKYNQLGAIDITQNVGLTFLNIRNNNFTSIDVSNNTLLETINIRECSNVMNLDVSSNTNLKFLYLQDVSLMSLDISQNTLLEVIALERNNLTTIDVSSNTALRQLRVSDNNITRLDASNNSALTRLSCDNNQLTFLDVQNGNNTAIATADFNATGNTELSCVKVDDATWSNTNWTNIDTGTTFYNSGICRYTAIPDTNFETALENLGYDDISGDGKVPTENIEVLTSLDLRSKVIANLTGIEDFILLTSLNLKNNSLTAINLSNNTALQTLGLSENDLTTIDLSKNINLTSLDLGANKLTALDVSNNVLLTRLECPVNDITSIDISKLTKLTFLELFQTDITTLDIKNNLVLEKLILYKTKLTSLDVSLNTELTQLRIDNTPITSIDLSTNTKLTEVRVNGSDITTVDLTNQVALTEFYGQTGVLEYINIKNGNNVNITNFDVRNNNDLSCITVDDAAYSTTNWTDISTATSFTEGTYCNYTAIPDSIFETRLEALGLDDISGDGQVPTALIETVTSLTVNDLGINELTGIEDFTALVTLNARGNNFTTLDVSKNTLLEHLYINSNSLSSIDVSKNVVLRNLNIGSNGITSLDVSNNPDLRDLWVQGNGGLTDLDLSNNLEIRELYTYSSGVSTLDLSIHGELRILSAYRTSMTSINLSNNPELRSLRVDETNISTLDLTNNTKIETLRVNDTGITTLDLGNQTNLEKLWAHDTDLSNLNVRNGNNANVTTFEIENNPNLTCVLVDDATYSTTNWTNKDTTTKFNETTCNYVQVAIDIYLQGAFINPNAGEESLMRDDLRASGGVYGSTSPYSDSATISDAIKLDDSGTNSMVDWVWVELRDANNPNQVIAGKSGILQRDGDIVAITDDRNSPMSFNVSADNYYIVVKHRNHLNIMTAAVISLSRTTTAIDLSSSSTAVAGGVNGVVDMGNGTFAMISGDFDENGQIQNIDANSVIQQLGVSGYNKADFDMNGQVQNSDINNLLNLNIGKGEQLINSAD
ncbi:hypothetical protein [uncultured Tenacibaculum sp.]|uniref:hypothetical protein n=1 Tax=uncultured Tenacibaculum sp. TaxID=174713 RepID=UPI0026188B92|nr:hypothetical protein [uncultured Tenacibaculum sp.]